MSRTRKTLCLCVLGASLLASAGVAWAQSASGVTSATAVTGAKPAQGAVPKVFAPTMPRASYTGYPWKTDIVATVFWVGEEPDDNNPTPNNKSSWDTKWQENFGGVDTPDPMKRLPNFAPAAFVPKLNPFYIALPYNDVQDSSTTRADAAQMIPWFKQRFSKPGKSVVKGQWLAIQYRNKVCYAQWEDCGPFETDDVNYVFGSARPKNQKNNGAGIDISPAIRDYLGMKNGGKVSWRFVDISEVPDGPWRTFGSAFKDYQLREQDQIRARLEQLRRLRDEYFRQNGSNEFRSR